jgi:hypothetical protein
MCLSAGRRQTRIEQGFRRIFRQGGPGRPLKKCTGSEAMPFFSRSRREKAGESVDSSRISQRRYRGKGPAAAGLTFSMASKETGPGGQQRSGSEPCTEITVPTEGRFRAWGALRSCFITSFCCDRLQEPPAASSGQKRPQQPYQAASGPFCPRSLLAALSLDLATKQVMKQLL